MGRVHYPFDVVIGALIGCVSALFSYWLVPKFSFIKQLITLYERVENMSYHPKTTQRDFEHTSIKANVKSGEIMGKEILFDNEGLDSKTKWDNRITCIKTKIKNAL